MTPFVSLSHPVRSVQIAFLLLGSPPLHAAGPVPLPVPAALAASRGVLERRVSKVAATSEAYGKSRRSSGTVFVEDRWAVPNNSFLTRPLVVADEVATALKLARSLRSADNLARRPRPFLNQQVLALNVLNRRVQISQVAVTRQRFQVVLMTRF